MDLQRDLGSNQYQRGVRWVLFVLLVALPVFLTISCGNETDTSSSDDGETAKRNSTDTTLVAYRKQVSELDARLQVEKPTNGYRIGVFTGEAQIRYTPDGQRDEPPSDALYLGVTLREKRTKRYLPGSSVKVSYGDHSWTLEETWGDVHHYGTNVEASFDQNAPLTVQVSPPAYGRHAEMKSVYINPASVSFPVESTDPNGHPVLLGSKPAPVSSDYKIGSSLQIALSESLAVKRAGPYRVGFIVEGAEPFWTWSDGELTPHPGNGTDANHFEIVLLDRETNEPIPHASISLSFKAGDTKKNIALFPLLAEFYHYGTNASVPSGKTYTVTASIEAPRLQTFKKDRFIDETVTFQWTKSE